MFDPVKAGQEAAAKNAEAEREVNGAAEEPSTKEIKAAKKSAVKNAKVDKGNITEAEMHEVPVGTADVDIPEGEVITDGEEPKAPELAAPVEHGHDTDAKETEAGKK